MADPNPSLATDLSAMLDELTAKVEAAKTKIQMLSTENAALKAANADASGKFRAALDSLAAALA